MNILWMRDGAKASAPTVVCLGFFDGVHLGHVRLIERGVQVARQKGLMACVHTFDRMPAQVLRPDTAPRELTPLGQKEGLIQALGVDLLAISRFADTMRMPARDFFQELLIGRLRARHIIAGFHHRFGYRGEGDAAQLASLCREAGIGLDIIDAVTLSSGELISSTAIRDAVAAGNIHRAEQMLGRPYDLA